MAVASMQIRLRPSARRMGRALGALGKDLTDFKPVFRRLLPVLAGDIENNLRQQGAPVGDRWAELSPSRIHQKQRKGLPMEALVASGALSAELSSPQRMQRSLTQSRLVVGPQSKLAYLHHFGGGRSNLPPRRFVAMSNSARRRVLRAMFEHNDRQVAAAKARIRAVGGSDS